MKDVDFGRLSEQYAGFLVAVGGVSITVLTLVLGISEKPAPDQIYARFFLVAALIVAAVCCFAGAHMMAETSAFFSHLQKQRPHFRPPNRILLGQRLFVLATANIFVGITLVLFAVVLLPKGTGKTELADLNMISGAVLISVALGGLVWMILAAIDRATAGNHTRLTLLTGALVGCGGGPLSLSLSPDCLPQVIFMVIVACTVLDLLYFAAIFKQGWEGTRFKQWWEGTRFWQWWQGTRLQCIPEIGIYSAAITFSNVSLVVAYFRVIWNF